MAWIKVPSEHHPLFRAALPSDPRVETMLMFGGIAAKVNGNIFAGLFGRSAMVFLSDADRADALALDGAAPFDPMGDGRARSDKIMLPEDVMGDPAELRSWIGRAFAFTATLPKKAAKPAKQPVAKQSAAKPSAAKQSAAKQSAAKPSAAKQSAAKPSAAKPSAAKPSAAKPSAAKPSAAKPSAAKPSAAKPSAAKPSAASTRKSSTKQSATKQPATKRPVASTRKSSTKQSATKQPRRAA
jgi:TfoX/Sxy family transcriptional regulator of competence genes